MTTTMAMSIATGMRLSVATMCMQRELGASATTAYQARQRRRWLYSSGQAQSLALERVPGSLRKEQARFPCETTFDKIFASRWLDDGDTIAFGTKCNRLVLWSPFARAVRVVALPKLTSSRRPSVQHAPSSSSPIITTAAGGGGGTGSPPTTAASVPPPDVSITGDPQLACGIHDIDVNDTHTALICGADNPADVVAFRTSTFEPATLLHGHADWVFASKFLANDVVVTGSRDGTVMLWRLSAAFGTDSMDDVSKYDPRIPLTIPTATLHAHEHKVRCIERGPWAADEFLTLSGDSTVKFWDSQRLVPTNTIILDEDTRDLVALSVSAEHNLVAVGSQVGTAIYDQRSNELVTRIPAVGGQWGVRCLTFNRDVLTIGGGSGTIGFYDLRTRQMRKESDHPFVQCSTGFLRNPEMFFGEDMPQAVYTVQYDSLNTRIFVGGGPLMCGLSGCYGSVWG